MINPPFGVQPDEIYVRCLNAPSSVIAFPSSAAEPDGVTYVRLVDGRGVECAYWDSQEWVDDPKVVMGAILGALVGGPLT
jgi:hypothetical protein